jgi:hypothetical protein
MHPCRPPPKPIKENGGEPAAAALSGPSANRAGSNAAGSGKMWGRRWEKAGDAKTMSPAGTTCVTPADVVTANGFLARRRSMISGGKRRSDSVIAAWRTGMSFRAAMSSVSPRSASRRRCLPEDDRLPRNAVKLW